MTQTTQLKNNKTQMPYFLNGIFFATLVALYSYLFYQQGIGINYLIFSLIIPMVYVLQNRNLIKNTPFLSLSAGAIFTGALCFYYGSDYHVFLNKISLLLLVGIVYAPKSSLITALVNSLYTYLAIPVHILLDFLKLKSQPVKRYGTIVKYLILSIIPIALASLFLLIYSFSNPILSQFLGQINWEFISIGFLFFILYSFLIIYGIFNSRGINTLINYDLKQKNYLDADTTILYKSFFNVFSIKSEIFIVSTVFILLNIVIGLNNSLDIYYLFIKKVLPQNLTYTEFLHQGVNSLIISIFLAIGLIMYFFSSRLNFVKNSIYIKIVAFAWIFQNAMLVFLCCNKNLQYITTFGLTYKRIGVYTFLLLAIIGLGFTFIKILKNKTNFYLIRTNSWVLYIVIITLSSYDWDQEIANYNINICKNKDIDYDYLLNLDHTAIPILYDNLIKDSIHYIKIKEVLNKSIYQVEEYEFLKYKEEKLVGKIELLKKENESYGTPSFCISRNKVLHKLN